MKLCFLILLFGLRPAKSYEHFMKTSTTPSNITCEQNSVFFTNHSSYQKCNEKPSCFLDKPRDKVFYFCLKKNFTHENCRKLSQKDYMVEPGCFYTLSQFYELPFYSYIYCHVFLLIGNMACSSTLTTHPYCSPFCYCILDRSSKFTIYQNSQVLIKFSNKKEEDFSEFFGEAKPQTTTKTKYDAFTASSLDPGDNYSIKETLKNDFWLGKDEKFINTAKVQTSITCQQNSFIISNHSSNWECDGKKTCWVQETNGDDFFYVCIKEQFQKSKCNLLTNSIEVPEKSGCFYTNKMFVDIHWKSKNYIHIFLLKTKITNITTVETYSAFSIFSCLECRLQFYSYSWILLKVSNKTEEDFSEFFVEANPKTTTKRKDDDITHTMTFAPTKGASPVERTITVSSLDSGDNSSTKKTPKKNFRFRKMFIILGTVIIVLMIIFVLVAFICYRKKHQKRETFIESHEGIVEIPLSGNEATDVNPYETDVNTYANTVPITGEGLNNDDYSSVDNVLYVASDSLDQSQSNAQNLSGTKETSPNSEAVYAVVNKQKVLKDDGSVPAGDSSHVVVNGDLYAVVNKQEPNYTLYL